MKLLRVALALVLAVLSGEARDLYVDPAQGDERANGLAAKPVGSDGPVKTIARGLKLAAPGDTVHLAPVVFRESAVFYNRKGEPGKPITLDGHGATLEGSDAIDPAGWVEVAPGLFRHDQLLPRLDDAIIGRWFFLWGGKMNHMGRTSKGPSAALKKPGELQAGEWTFAKDESRKVPDSRLIFGAFYLRLPAGQALAAARIAAPVRSAGVQFSGENRHLVIRNLTATHVYNDGFNIHGHCEDVLFENIRAIECGDDGISAHETAQYRVKGFVSIGNSTGICDTGASVTSYDRVFIKDCLGHDLYFLDTGRYTLRNAVVLSSAAHAFVLTGREQMERPCSLTLDNLLIRRVRGAGEIRVMKHSVLTANRATFENLNFQAIGGDVTLENCRVGGDPAPEMHLWKGVQWRGRNNRYDLRALRFEQASFTSRNFADFQKLTGSETDSRWGSPPAAKISAGADLEELKAIAWAAGEDPGLLD